MLWLIVIVQLTVIFLFTMNSFLEGFNKATIASWLGWLWAGCVVAAIIIFGWDGAAATVGMTFIAPIALRGVAARAAAALMRVGTPGTYPGAPPNDLLRLSRILGGHGSIPDPAKLFAEMSKPGPSREDIALDQLLDIVLDRPSSRQILHTFGADREVLRQEYRRLVSEGAGQWAGAHFAAASAIYFDASLKFLLSGKRAGLSDSVTVGSIIEYFRSGSPLPETVFPEAAQ